MSEPRYSGHHRTGRCICGHQWHEHHLGVVMNDDYRKETKEGYLPEECEHYGFNEMGGLGPDGEDHCQRYRDIMEKAI